MMNKTVNKIINDHKAKQVLEQINISVDNTISKSVELGVNRCIEQFSTCFAAALIEAEPDLFTLEDILKIDDVAKIYFEENLDFISNVENWREYLDSMENEVKLEIIKLLDKDKSQADIIKAIKKKYPTMKSSHLQLAFKTAKDEWLKPTTIICKDKEDLVVEQAFIQNKKEQGKEVESIELGARMKKDKKVVEEPKTFEIKSKTILFDGKYGEYKIENNTLTKDENTYKSFKDIAKKEEEILLEIKNKFDEIRQAFKMI